ncbi:uncharacterized protein Dwil_GK27733, isoform B [Drosophila willistoni]|uniref:Uncharacterized protein, isoform B n=1 Tax=Drosophila willistoni TaxID=7260 RepID=A0A0Q9WQI3_DROWI|nr:uncharacterized protein Dwil_GK27733, isoform B [Drosophila willistoni]
MQVTKSTFLLVALSLSVSSVLGNPKPFFGFGLLPDLGSLVGNAIHTGSDLAGNLLNSSANLAENFINKSASLAGDLINTKAGIDGKLLNASANLAGNFINKSASVAGDLIDAKAGLDGKLINAGANLAGNLLNSSAHLAGNLLNSSANLAGNFINKSASVAGDLIDAKAGIDGQLLNASANLAGNLLNSSANLAGNFINKSASLAGDLINAKIGLDGKLLNASANLAGNFINKSASLAGNLIHTGADFVGHLLNSSSGLIKNAVDSKIALDKKVLNATSALGQDLAQLGLKLALGVHEAATQALKTFASNLASLIAGISHHNGTGNATDSLTHEALEKALQVLKNVSTSALQLEAQLASVTAKLEAAKLKYGREIQEKIVDWLREQVDRVENRTEEAEKISRAIQHHYANLIQNAVGKFVAQLALFEQSVERTIKVFNNATINLAHEVENALKNGFNSSALASALQALEEAPLKILALNGKTDEILALGQKAALKVSEIIAKFEAEKISIIGKFNAIIAENLGNLLKAGDNFINNLLNTSSLISEGNVTSNNSQNIASLGIQIALGLHEAANEAVLSFASNITSAIAAIQKELKNATTLAKRKTLSHALVILKKVGSAALQLESQFLNATHKIESAKLKFAQKIQKDILDWLKNQKSRVENATHGNGTEAADKIINDVLKRYGSLIHSSVEQFVAHLALYEHAIVKTISHFNNATFSIAHECQNSTSTAITSALNVLKRAPIKLVALETQTIEILNIGALTGLHVTAIINEFNAEKLIIIGNFSIIIANSVGQ